MPRTRASSGTVRPGISKLPPGQAADVDTLASDAERLKCPGTREDPLLPRRVLSAGRAVGVGRAYASGSVPSHSSSGRRPPAPVAALAAGGPGNAIRPLHQRNASSRVGRRSGATSGRGGGTNREHSSSGSANAIAESTTDIPGVDEQLVARHRGVAARSRSCRRRASLARPAGASRITAARTETCARRMSSSASMLSSGADMHEPLETARRPRREVRRVARSRAVIMCRRVISQSHSRSGTGAVQSRSASGVRNPRTRSRVATTSRASRRVATASPSSRRYETALTISGRRPGKFARYSRRSALSCSTSARYSSTRPCRS